MQSNLKPNKPVQQDTSAVLKRVRKRVYRQALLAGMLIILTVVIMFAVTSAWYTNIVQSSGLVFETSVWGFEGTVFVSEGGIKAAPGDEGIIELVAENESSELTAVSLNVSKAQMDEMMRKRIFFYIDTSKVRNNETMERIYLSNQDSYTYLLFSNQSLLLTETIHNDALLKWHWVYDVLGYYVQGTFVDGTMMVSEYLRPIEYEFDEARTTFTGGNGQLATIDGSKTAGQFLRELSAKDGYAGIIDISKAETTYDGRIYYPVAVNEATGEGVWAYLCTYSEIMTNTREDTTLGQQAGQGILPVYTATLTIAAQNSNYEAVQVSTSAALIDQINQALYSGTKAIIQLGGDVTLTQPLVIGNSMSQQVMVDLNGNTLTVDSGTYAEKAAGIQVSEGSALTLMNGTLTGTSRGYALSCSAAEIALSNVSITGVETALDVRDNKAVGTGDSKIRLEGCLINCSEEGIYLSGNGSDSAQTTQLIIENTTIDSGYIGVMGNGSNNQAGTDIQIICSVVKGYWAGVYHPQADSVLVISEGSSVSGYTGLTVKGGSVQILDSSIAGTGAQNTPTSAPMSGFNDTGDAIYIESNYGTEILVEIRGNSIVDSTYAQALRIFPNSSNVKVSIYGGTFSSDVSEYRMNDAS